MISGTILMLMLFFAGRDFIIFMQEIQRGNLESWLLMMRSYRELGEAYDRLREAAR